MDGSRSRLLEKSLLPFVYAVVMHVFLLCSLLLFSYLLYMYVFVHIHFADVGDML